MSFDAKIDELIAAIKENTAALKGGATGGTKSSSKSSSVDGDDAKSTEKKATTTRGKKTTEKKEIAREDVVAIFGKVREEFGTDEAKALVKKLGVAKLADLEEDQFEKAMQLAQAKLESGSEEGDGGDDDI